MKCLICDGGQEFIQFRIRQGAIYSEDGTVKRFHVFVQDDGSKTVCLQCFSAMQQMTQAEVLIPF